MADDGMAEGGAKASDYAYHALFPEFASKAGQAGGSVLDLINVSRVLFRHLCVCYDEAW